MEVENKIPTPSEVKSIYRETYDLFTANKECTSEADYDQLINQVISIQKKYPYELTKLILGELLNIISAYDKNSVLKKVG